MKKLIPLLFLLTSCSASYYQQRDVKKQHQLNYQYQGELAKDCATLFPVKDSIGTPIYTPSHNIDYSGKVDSLKKYADSLKGLPRIVVTDTAQAHRIIIFQAKQINTLTDKINALRAAYKPCKPDTIVKPIYRVDEAKLKALQNDDNIKTDSLKITKHDLVNSKKSASKGWLYFWILVGSLVIIIVAKVIIFFYGGGWANTIKNVI